MLLADLKAKAEWLYGAPSAKKMLRAVLSDATLSLLIYRSMSWCFKIRFLKPLAALLCKLNSILCGAVIGMGATFDEGFVILHSVGVVVNTRVKGGRNIYLESGVVIGETKRGCPVLGNNIFVGSGAKIVGDIVIGDNVTIGANAVVNKSFPSNVVIGGVPAKVIRTKDASETSLVG
jgi:serine O-acetyltransferase